MLEILKIFILCNFSIVFVGILEGLLLYIAGKKLGYDVSIAKIWELLN